MNNNNNKYLNQDATFAYQHKPKVKSIKISEVHKKLISWQEEYKDMSWAERLKYVNRDQIYEKLMTYTDRDQLKYEQEKIVWFKNKVIKDINHDKAIEIIEYIKAQPVIHKQLITNLAYHPQVEITARESFFKALSEIYVRDTNTLNNNIDNAIHLKESETELTLQVQQVNNNISNIELKTQRLQEWLSRIEQRLINESSLTHTIDPNYIYTGPINNLDTKLELLNTFKEILQYFLNW